MTPDPSNIDEPDCNMLTRARLRMLAACLALAMSFCPTVGRARTMAPFAPLMYHFLADAADPSAVFVSTEAGVFRSIDGGATWARFGTGPREFTQGVWSLVPDPTRPGRLYAISTSGPLLRSTDGARTWERLDIRDAAGNPIEHHDLRLHAIAVDPRNGSVLLLGTSLGILRSADAGRSWISVHSGNRIMENGLLFDPAKPGRVVAGTDGAILLSDDGGLTWPAGRQAQIPGVAPAWVGDFKAYPDRSLYANASGQPLLSSDSGSTWVSPSGACSTFDMASDGKTLLTSCGRGDSGSFTKRSVDAGVTWEEVQASTPNHQFRGTSRFWFHPGKPSLVLAAHYMGGLSRSEDGGKTWTDGSIGLRWCEIAPANSYLFAHYPSMKDDCAKPQDARRQPSTR